MHNTFSKKKEMPAALESNKEAVLEKKVEDSEAAKKTKFCSQLSKPLTASIIKESQSIEQMGRASFEKSVRIELEAIRGKKKPEKKKTDARKKQKKKDGK